MCITLCNYRRQLRRHEQTIWISAQQDAEFSQKAVEKRSPSHVSPLERRIAPLADIVSSQVGERGWARMHS